MIEVLERIAKQWEEEIGTAGDRTNLRPTHLQQLKKRIDKAYAMENKARQYEEQTKEWADKIGW